MVHANDAKFREGREDVGPRSAQRITLDVCRYAAPVAASGTFFAPFARFDFGGIGIRKISCAPSIDVKESTH